MTPASFVSVIIPVYNDPIRLESCLAALEVQSYPKHLYEVIVIDNASDKSIEPIVAKFKQARAESEPHSGSFAARNKGVSVASGELLAFTDSDCIPMPDWIKQGVATLQKTSNCGVVGGKVELFFQNPAHPTVAELYDAVTYLRQEWNIEYISFSATANLFTYKHVFNHVGNFLGGLEMSDDREWGQRVASFGYSLVYTDDACVKHPARYSLAELLAKERRTARGHVVYKSKKDNRPPLHWNFDSLTSRLLPLPPVGKIHTLQDVSFGKKMQVLLTWFLVRYVMFEEKLRMKFLGKAP